MGMGDERLVTAKIVVETLGIPRATLYRLVEHGKVRAIDVTQDWHEVRQYRFSLDDVRADLARIKAQRERVTA
jgi:predicted site-specific integrase-resolvase